MEKRGSLQSWFVFLIIAIIVLVLVSLFISKSYGERIPNVLENIFGGFLEEVETP